MAHDRIVERAVQYIRSQQNQGQFNHTTFYSSLIATALAECTEHIADSIKEDCTLFLLQQKNSGWSFNYWIRNTTEYTNKPYPDDLDDTFAALTAIYHNAPHHINEETWQSIMALLINNEVATGGPYETWILHSEKDYNAWHDVDIVVNACIANFLALSDIRLPNLIAYIDTAIIENNIASKYYHQEYIVLYFVTSNYKGVYADLLRKRILALQHPQGHWNTPFATALCTTALLRLGENPAMLRNAINYLEHTEHNGMWQSDPFFIESISTSETIYSSCSAHCSACVVEAIILYQKACSDFADNSIISDKQLYCNNILNSCRTYIKDSVPQIELQFEHSLQALTIKDPNSEIVLLSYNFLLSLKPECQKKTFSQTVLSMANVFGWIGYSAMDAIIDGESSITLLSMTLTCIRTSALLFISQTYDDHSKETVKNILDGIESSLAWEQSIILQMTDQRLLLPDTLPDYGDYYSLAAKSLGHALGPMLLCLELGELDQAILVKQFFIHYLIARQLHDDAHDWLEDLRRGFINSVAVGILAAWRTTCNKNILHIESEQEKLQSLFWNEHIDVISQEIISQCHKAQALLSKIVIISDSSYLESLLLPLKQSAHKAVVERNKTMALLALIAE
jgi:hypothetical protein